jgi:hypothetical protein
MSQRELPAPNLEHLKNQARTPLQQRLASDAAAIDRFAVFGITLEIPKHADAVVALSWWRELNFLKRASF